MHSSPSFARPSARPSRRRIGVAIAAAALLLAACTGRGGGWLPPDGLLYSGKAVVGFSFSCERSSRSVNTNPPTGRLKIELSYTDLGRSPIGTGFSIHAIADRLDPVLESAVCIGQEPPPGGNELIFLGTYRLLAGAPAGFARACAAKQTSAPPCRLEVIVRDNDQNQAPSKGDFFSIRLSTVTDTTITDFPVPSVFYARAGLLAGGEISVD